MDTDPRQNTITAYFSVLNEMDLLMKQNTKLSKLLQHVHEKKNELTSPGIIQTNQPTLFARLMESATKNSEKFPNTRRYTEVIKKFSTSLFIYSGPLAYNFIQQNMPATLPSLRTVQRSVRKEYLVIKDGEFRFDGLLKHLKRYGCPNIVSIGEDATRLISRVDYDNNNDELVGFVLPVNSQSGLPILDSFKATSFDAIEHHFTVGSIANYAFVYVAQPLSKSAPSFIIACLSTDNRFKAEHVTKRWRYIHSECMKLGIRVIAFGADGDSREMKSMRAACQLHYKPDDLTNSSLSSILPQMKLPKSWLNWFALKNPTNACYVQDIVHIAVKMKSRLLKPSIILPLGKYTAGAHNLALIRTSFHKGEHGMREKDLNQKGKQNYESVMRITSCSVIELLKKTPDGLGTLYYLDVMCNIIDSYLNKQLSPLDRIEKIWYACFF